MALQNQYVKLEDTKHSSEHIKHKIEENKEETGKSQEQEISKEEKIKETKKQESKPEKKEEAIAKGTDLHLSKKQCMYICSFIKNKNIDSAISDLELVTKLKKPVPFKGEIPHRKGIMSGRYPISASKVFIKLLKGLKGNVLVNNMDLDKTRIKIASASWASRPLRSGNRKAKRTNVILKATES